MGFSEIFSGALATLRGVAGETVTYTRGANSVTLSASLGNSRIEIMESSGAVTVVDSRDFLIAVEDLVLNSVAVTPRTGDTITETCGGITYVYRVLDLPTDQCYRFSDVGRTQFRIHTKLVSKT